MRIMKLIHLCSDFMFGLRSTVEKGTDGECQDGWYSRKLR